MPLTFGLLVGILAVIVGLVLFVRTGKKKLAMVIVVLGFTLALVTVVFLVLAVNSGV